MRKNIVLLVITLMILNCITPVAHAKEGNVLYHADEITNLDTLDNRAENGINEAPQSIVQEIFESSTVTIGNRDIDKNNIKITSQKLSEIAYGDYTITDYTVSLIYYVDFDELEAMNSDVYTHIASRAKETKEVKGPTTDAAIYSKIHFTTGTMRHGGYDVKYMKLDKVTGTFRITDSSCKLTNRKVRGGYSGFNLNTSQFVSTTSAWTSGTGTTVERSIGGPPLETPTGPFAQIWGESQCLITRYNQSWTVTAFCAVSSTNVWW